MSAEEITFSPWNIALSLLVSILAGVIVGVIFLKGFKPKSEKVFEDNRQSQLQWIFGQIKQYDDMHVDYIFKKFEKEFGPLERERKELM